MANISVPGGQSGVKAPFSTVNHNGILKTDPGTHVGKADMDQIAMLQVTVTHRRLQFIVADDVGLSENLVCSTSGMSCCILSEEASSSFLQYCQLLRLRHRCAALHRFSILGPGLSEPSKVDVTAFSPTAWKTFLTPLQARAGCQEAWGQTHTLANL